jgi:hypothetical protein
MIKTASENHAPPDETCKLFVAYGQSELKMIKYIESHQAKCGIPRQVGDQLRAGRKNTEVIQKKVCDAARQQHPKWLQIANRLRLSGTPVILEGLIQSRRWVRGQPGTTQTLL